MSDTIYVPLTVDADPAIRGSEGHVVVSDARGNVAFLVPFAAYDDGTDNEEQARARATAYADAVNAASEEA